eukprot:CAMPEP_0194321438 /NCGR_PEP_ID=MMETSP0171-20130528/17654_1 /TAXON_ID=218684 /ORGANISM="Corethron pennatum, Strain L29A3" /LENGTH=527 /DNA_ID=CAMNT_0039079339 /DNA_START=371 /DNA_END=1954 /DNA_ORIENTATION=-
MRCCVYMTAIFRHSQYQQPKHLSDENGTLIKKEVLDHGWEVSLKAVFPNSDDEKDASIPGFGHKNIFELIEKYDVQLVSGSVESVKTSKDGYRAISRLLNVVHNVYGVDYCPLLPDISLLLLCVMPESCASSAIREMVHVSPFYFSISPVEHCACCKTFVDMIMFFFPETHATMQKIGVTKVENLAPILERFFIPIMPQHYVMRIFDCYLVEGYKAIFRFGLALIASFKSDMKCMNIKNSQMWWTVLRNFTFSPSFNFDLLKRKAYSRFGSKMRKRHNFPSRRTFARNMKLNEKWAESNVQMDYSYSMSKAKAVGIIETEHPPVMARSHAVRFDLASWLPLPLRETKLELIYSTSLHGRCLESFYKSCAHSKHTLTLIETLTPQNAKIGMYTNHTWHHDSRIYGDGSCFIFSLEPDSKKYSWSPDKKEYSFDEDQIKMRALNEQFMMSNHSFLSMGGNKDGTCGIRLNEDLSKGSSAATVTFKNAPLVGEDFQDFEVGLIEVYRFIRNIDGSPVDGNDHNVWDAVAL